MIARAREGYILPLALASITVIALVAAIAASQVRRASDTVYSLSERARLEAEMISAEQTLIYLLLTEPIAAEGINIGGESALSFLGEQSLEGQANLLRADGTPRAFGGDGSYIRLYDQQSFLNFSSTDEATQDRNLSLFDVPAETRGRLIASLADFQDDDSLRRLGGAEKPDYEAPHLPANRPLRDILELCSVQGWGETPVCQDHGRLLLLGQVRSSDQINRRLASVALLEQMTGDEESARQAKRALRSGEISSFTALGHPAFDRETDILSVPGYPGPIFALVTHDGEGGAARRTVIELTPNNVTAPFLIRNRYVIGGDYARRILAIEDEASVEEIPEPATNSRIGGRPN